MLQMFKTETLQIFFYYDINELFFIFCLILDTPG